MDARSRPLAHKVKPRPFRPGEATPLCAVHAGSCRLRARTAHPRSPPPRREGPTHAPPAPALPRVSMRCPPPPISFRRAQDPGGGWESGRLRPPSPPGTPPGPPEPPPGPLDPGAAARSFYESLVQEGGPEPLQGPPAPHFCPICRSPFGDPPPLHFTSTPHLLALREGAPPPLPSPPKFHLPPSNLGFRMLLRGGWKGGGLGRGGQGPSSPVPTRLKRDRGGLGWREGDEGPPRVTHFGPGDVGAVAWTPPRKLKKGGTGGKNGERPRPPRSEEAERAWERRLRAYMRD